jgi:hypothetical protein
LRPHWSASFYIGPPWADLVGFIAFVGVVLMQKYSGPKKETVLANGGQLY